MNFLNKIREVKMNQTTKKQISLNNLQSDSEILKEIERVERQHDGWFSENGEWVQKEDKEE